VGVSRGFDLSRSLRFCFGAAVFTTGSRAGGLLLPDGLLQCPYEPAAPGDPVLHGQQQRREAGLRDWSVVIRRDR
jgi:hypothetical protein